MTAKRIMACILSAASAAALLNGLFSHVGNRTVSNIAVDGIFVVIGAVAAVMAVRVRYPWL